MVLCLAILDPCKGNYGKLEGLYGAMYSTFLESRIN